MLILRSAVPMAVLARDSDDFSILEPLMDPTNESERTIKARLDYYDTFRRGVSSSINYFTKFLLFELCFNFFSYPRINKTSWQSQNQSYSLHFISCLFQHSVFSNDVRYFCRL